jgi:hypothetical protein
LLTIVERKGVRPLQYPEWMRAKLKATDVNALIAGYQFVKPSAEMELILGALRLSSHVLAADTGQFAGRWWGACSWIIDLRRFNSVHW